VPDVLEQPTRAQGDTRPLQAAGGHPDGAPTAVRRSRRSARLASEYGIVAITLLTLVVGLVAVPGFGSSENLSTLMRDASFVGIVALGMTFVVMSGNYVDLSVAAQVGAAAVCTVALQPHGQVVALLAGVACCLAIGIVNGIAVGYVRANAVVVTLGVGTVGFAVMNEITAGAQYAGHNEAFADIAGASLGPIPISFVAFVAVAVGCAFALDRMGYGRRLRAVGSNRAVAALAGVASGRVVLGAFLVTAGCCWLSGVLLSGFVNSANPTIANDFTFEALAAVIVGGTSLTGGRGGAGRTVVGVLLIAVIANLLVVAGLSFEWQQLVKGVVIVIAVAFDALTRRLVAR
jgi:ribose transport system permease protein